MTVAQRTKCRTPECSERPERRGYCQPCARRQTFVTLIAGPPGAGKTHYAAQHAAEGDVTLDLDALWQAVTGLMPYEKPIGVYPVPAAMYEAAVTEIGKGLPDVGHVWVIATVPGQAERATLRDRVGADEVVVLETPVQTCINRTRSRPEPAGAPWAKVIKDWWLHYERDARDRQER